MKKILLIEDDKGLIRVVGDRLKINGYSFTSESNGNLGLQTALNSNFDVILVDLMLPEVSGFDIIRELRNRGNTAPIIILSAKFQLSDKVSGLRLGADDYLVKPFEFDELLARIETNIRRTEINEIEKESTQQTGDWLDLDQDLIQFDDIEIDFHSCEVKKDRCKVAMSNIEFRLLSYFVLNQDRVIKIDELLEKVWKYDDGISTRTLYVHIAWLRKKLETDVRQYIHTVRGVGYKFNY